MKKTASIILIYFCTSVSAYAYLDPGTGSVFMQMIVLFIAGIGAGIGLYWNKAKNLLAKIFSSKKKNKN